MSGWDLFWMNPAAPFEYPFMWKALAVASLVGGVCAVLSCYLILKGWSLMGDAISHAIFPGVVLAYLVGIPLSVGAFLAGLFCAISTGFIKVRSRIKEDAVLGIVFTGMFGLGMIVFSKIETDVHLNHILFGSLLGVSSEQLNQTLMTTGVTLIGVLLIRRDLFLFCFDASHARCIGLPTGFLYYLLLALLSVCVVASLQAVGAILVISMLITPGGTAKLLCNRFDSMLCVASLSAVSSAFLGTYVSYFINGATGSCIVLIQFAQFLVALLYSQSRAKRRALTQVAV